MKAAAASLLTLFSFAQSAHAQNSISDFVLGADKNFSFKLAGPEGPQEIKGEFQTPGRQKIAGGSFTVHVSRLEKFVVITAVKSGQRTGNVFILEEMNSLFVPLTISAIAGNAPALHEDALRMLEISRIANNGHLAAGVQKVIEAFRQNPKLTVQMNLARMASRPSHAPIGVGERNRIQSVRSFEELERGAGKAAASSTRPRRPQDGY